MAASRTKLGPPRPGPPRPDPSSDPLELDLDPDDDLDTAPPTERPIPRAQTALGLGDPASNRSSQVGTEFDVKQGDGRIDTTGLELQEIADSVPPPRSADGDELEVSLPTAWSQNPRPDELESTKPRTPDPIPTHAEIDGIGEELDLGAAPCPNSDPPPPATAPVEDDAEQARLDSGLSASSLVGVLDRAERVREAFAPRKERQIDITGTRRVQVDVDSPDPSTAPPPPASPRSEAEEFDFLVAESEPPNPLPAFSGDELDLDTPTPAPLPAGPDPLESGLSGLALDRSDLPPPSPPRASPSPAPLPRPVTGPADHGAALDLEVSPRDLHVPPIPAPYPGDSIRPTGHDPIVTPVGQRGATLPVQSQNPLEGAIHAPLAIPKEPTVHQRPVHDSIVPELEVRSTSSSPPRMSSRPPPTDVQPGMGIRELQLDEEDAAAPSLDLAEAPRHSRGPAKPPPPRSIPSPSALDPDLDDEVEDETFGETVELAEAPRATQNLAADGQAMPTCRTPDAADLTVLPDQVERIARFGEVPRNPLAAPLYALRVYGRRRALRGELARARRALQDAEIDRDTQLAEIFLQHRDKLQTQEHLGAMLDAVHGTEADHEVVRREFAEVSAEYQQRQRELTIRREHADQVLKAQQQTEAARQDVYQKCEDDYNRVAVRFKRLQIELRNIKQQEQQEPDRAVPLEVQDKRTRQLAAKQRKTTIELNKLMPQAKRLRTVMEGAAKELENAQRTTRKAAGQLQVIEAERRALDSWYAKQTASYGTNVREAEAAYLTAKADVVRAALSVGAATLDAHTLERLRDQDRHIRDLAREAHRLLLAFDAYDPDAYRQGFVTGLSLCIALLLLVVVSVLFL